MVVIAIYFWLLLSFSFSGLDQVCDAVMHPDSSHEIELLIKKLDKNGDCKITQEEFAAALREKGLKCSNYRAWYAVYCADIYHRDHVIRGKIEISKLLDIVKKNYPWMLTNP